MARNAPESYDVAVVGGGPTGWAAALVAAEAGLSAVLFAPPARHPPARTAALLHGSINLLESLGVWALVEPRAAPLRAMRIVDATGRLIRSPEVTFHATEIGLAAFGYNVANAELVEGLAARARAAPGLAIVRAPVHAIHMSEAAAELAPAAGDPVAARLVIGADGAHSLARAAAGIASRSWSYSQSALVAVLETDAPHQDVSTEFHTENGPFTLVPLSGRRMSLVWVDRPHALEATAFWDDARFGAEAAKRAHYIVGGMRAAGPRTLYPLQGALADRFAGPRTMLVGEAAHCLPPIGAQGLNLGLRDVAALRPILGRYRADPGQADATAAFHNARQMDVRTRTLAIDLLNRSLLTGFLPVQAARSLGLALVDAVPALRRLLMRQGLASRIGLSD